jgi:hypothetical protein
MHNIINLSIIINDAKGKNMIKFTSKGGSGWRHYMLQPYLSVRMKLTLPKWGLGNPLGLPKVQNSIVKVKTPHIGAFFISLEKY